MGWRFTAIAIAPLIPVGTLLLAWVQPPSANVLPVLGEVTLRGESEDTLDVRRRKLGSEASSRSS